VPGFGRVGCGSGGSAGFPQVSASRTSSISYRSNRQHDHGEAKARGGGPVVGSHSRVGSGSSLDELLSAVDVEGRAGDRRVRHEVDGQCGYVGRTDDPSDWQVGTELLAARVQLVAEERRR
jgi:hypothetical protein